MLLALVATTTTSMASRAVATAAPKARGGSFIDARARKLLDGPLTPYTNAAIVKRHNIRVVPEASGSPPAQAP
jgi:hypothetical protein